MRLEERILKSLTPTSKSEIYETCIKNTCMGWSLTKFFSILTDSWLVVGAWEKTHSGGKGERGECTTKGEERVWESSERGNESAVGGEERESEHGGREEEKRKAREKK